ncbi:MerR family DNA-binding transcriptional regulator [Peribacillus frigoritolerans]|uniref:MerR family DNA-binding transcriptional regulator n=1 Tax=Peribacillus castrilensis TaxID=2897690 RepID=UPI003DA2ECE6
MQNKLSIGEMAKLRGVTVDTLRHYDKIGLLKPFHIDPETGYRYYSISQYEALAFRGRSGSLLGFRLWGLTCPAAPAGVSHFRSNQP